MLQGGARSGDYDYDYVICQHYVLCGFADFAVLCRPANLGIYNF